MEVKTQEQVLKLFSACVVIISIQRNEQNTLEYNIIFPPLKRLEESRVVLENR